MCICQEAEKFIEVVGLHADEEGEKKHAISQARGYLRANRVREVASLASRCPYWCCLLDKQDAGT